MSETITTCSLAISFAKELENESAKFYTALADQSGQDKEVLLSFAKKNKEFVTQVERAYYGVISDAFEGCFAFNMNPEDYKLDTELAAQADYAGALKKALANEEAIVRFYQVAAEQSKSLMADVPRAFKLVARKRDERQSVLKSLLEKQA